MHLRLSPLTVFIVAFFVTLVFIVSGDDDERPRPPPPWQDSSESPATPAPPRRTGTGLDDYVGATTPAAGTRATAVAATDIPPAAPVDDAAPADSPAADSSPGADPGQRVTPDTNFTLATDCPRAFSLDAAGNCIFDNPYAGFTPPWELTNHIRALPALPGPFTPQQIDLGRLLFFDPVLSGAQDTSCAHCHHPDDGFADGHGRSRGVGASGAGHARRGGVELPRGAPSLWNIGFADKLFVDGRAPNLQEQAMGPLFSPDEMAANPQDMMARLAAIPAYEALFLEAFGEGEPVITLGRVLDAIAAFQSTLVSFDSPYDRYTLGDRTALSDAQQRGHDLFHSFMTRCANCHVPPLFSDNQLVVIGAREPPGKAFDPGAGAVTDDPTLHGAFRTPQLRNVALTAPYMHSGGEATLREAVAFYNEKRGHAVPEGEPVLIHWLIFADGRLLSDRQVDDLTAFLHALNDQSAMPELPLAVPSGLPVVPRLEAQPRVAGNRGP